MGQEGMEKLRGAGWETFDHVADIGVRGIGLTVEEAFENGAKALFSIMVEDLSEVIPRETVPVSCSSYDLTGLFVAWLNELIGVADIREMVFREFTVQINNVSLKGTAKGQRWDQGNISRGIEVKGATFTKAIVEKSNGFYVAQCVVDV
ncbi:MAG: archease [Thermodesulfatator sp.]|nr:MAG: archease [Thermodesulfatator sp.]